MVGKGGLWGGVEEVEKKLERIEFEHSTTTKNKNRKFNVGEFESFFPGDNNNSNPDFWLVLDSNLQKLSQALTDENRLKLLATGAGQVWLQIGFVGDLSGSESGGLYNVKTISSDESSIGSVDLQPAANIECIIREIKSIVSENKRTAAISPPCKILWLITSNEELSRNDIATVEGDGEGKGKGKGEPNIPNPITLALVRFRSLVLACGEGNVALVHEKLPKDTIKSRIKWYNGDHVDILVSMLDSNGGGGIEECQGSTSNLTIIENCDHFFGSEGGGLSSLFLFMEQCSADQNMLVSRESDTVKHLLPLCAANPPYSLRELAMLDKKRKSWANHTPIPPIDMEEGEIDFTRLALLQGGSDGEESRKEGENWLTFKRAIGDGNGNGGEDEVEEGWTNYFTPPIPRGGGKKKLKKVMVLMVEGVDEEKEGEGEMDEENNFHDDDDAIELAKLPKPKTKHKSKTLPDELASKLSGRESFSDQQLKRRSNTVASGNSSPLSIGIDLSRPDLTKAGGGVVYLIVDVETTGFDAVGGDRITQIATKAATSFSEFDDENNFDSFSSYVCGGNERENGGGDAEGITGISNSFLERGGVDPSTGILHSSGAPTFGKVYEAFLKWLEQLRITHAVKNEESGDYDLPVVVLVAHNARFDIGFLNAEVKRYRGEEGGGGGGFAKEAKLRSYVDTLAVFKDKGIWSRPRKWAFGGGEGEGGEGLMAMDVDVGVEGRKLPPVPPASYGQVAIYDHLFPGEGQQGSHNAMGDVVGLSRILGKLEGWMTETVGWRHVANRLQVIFPSCEI